MNLNSAAAISFIAALLISLLVSTCVALGCKLYAPEFQLGFIIAAGLGTLSFSFLIILVLIKLYIQKKIKLIYRIIKDSKIKTDPKIDLSKNVMQELTKDVQQWADLNKERIRELEIKENYRREFIGNVSHELKTPIFSIQGYLLTLLEGGLEDEKINRKFLGKAEKGVERLINIVDDLNDIAQYDTGQLKIIYEKTDLVAMAKEVMDDMAFKAKKSSVTIRFGKDSYDPIFALCDKKRIAQVLYNLINNSIKYSEENKVVKLRFHDIEDRILIEVADEGLGIEEKHLTRLFERFYRVEESRNRDKGGSGLGLSICKHIVEAHGETMNVRSSVGVGSTFSFTLRKV